MNPTNMFGRRAASAALVVILIAGLIAVANMTSISRAQDDRWLNCCRQYDKH
jgi:hypothetical protein